MTQIFAYYLGRVRRNGKVYTLTRERMRKGLNRLEQAQRIASRNLADAAELMKGAIEEMCASGWHMGRDPKSAGRRFCDWDKHLLNSAEQFQDWITKALEAQDL